MLAQSKALFCRPPSALPVAGPLGLCADGSWGPPPSRGPPAAQVPPPAARGLLLPPPPPTAPPPGPRRSEPPAPQRCPSGRRAPALCPSPPFPVPSPRAAPPLLVAGPALPFASGRRRAAPPRRRRPPPPPPPPLGPAPRDAALGLAHASRPAALSPRGSGRSPARRCRWLRAAMVGRCVRSPAGSGELRRDAACFIFIFPIIHLTSRDCQILGPKAGFPPLSV